MVASGRGVGWNLLESHMGSPSWGHGFDVRQGPQRRCRDGAGMGPRSMEEEWSTTNLEGKCWKPGVRWRPGNYRVYKVAQK
jgi:hypothetical protein